jgi:hypothetical protein
MSKKERERLFDFLLLLKNFFFLINGLFNIILKLKKGKNFICKKIIN